MSPDRTDTKLPANSVDYVFTDPPFGGNIPYAEVNFINEAWLGECTDSRQEITISRVQRKAASDYQSLMTRAFREMKRVLKPSGRATVVFHSSSAAVWNALQRAYIDAGMSVELASVLEKTQGSFKQVTTNGAVKGDPLLLLRKERARYNGASDPATSVADGLLEHARRSRNRIEQTPQRLYSRFVNHYLTRDQSVPLSADDFYRSIAYAAKKSDGFARD